MANDSSAGSLRAGQRVERKVMVGIKVGHRRKERARRLASRAWFGLGVWVGCRSYRQHDQSRQSGNALNEKSNPSHGRAHAGQIGEANLRVWR